MVAYLSCVADDETKAEDVNHDEDEDPKDGVEPEQGALGQVPPSV